MHNDHLHLYLRYLQSQEPPPHNILPPIPLEKTLNPETLALTLYHGAILRAAHNLQAENIGIAKHICYAVYKGYSESKIGHDAFLKYILFELLQNGQINHTVVWPLEMEENVEAMYQDIIKKCYNCEKYEDQLKEHGNWALAQLAIKMKIRRRIQNLSLKYTIVSEPKATQLFGSDDWRPFLSVETGFVTFRALFDEAQVQPPLDISTATASISEFCTKSLSFESVVSALPRRFDMSGKQFMGEGWGPL